MGACASRSVNEPDEVPMPEVAPETLVALVEEEEEEELELSTEPKIVEDKAQDTKEQPLINISETPTSEEPTSTSSAQEVLEEVKAGALVEEIKEETPDDEVTEKEVKDEEQPKVAADSSMEEDRELKN